MERQWLFDREWTQDFTRVRQEFMGDFLRNARRQHELTSALDLGCGVGYFSKHLFDLNFQVVAVDGREENVAEARARYPAITFVTRNAEDPRLPEIGSFDFVACIGLLYHLENPFRAIRNLHALTGKILLIETMCVPKAQATMYLLDEGIAEDQGLNYVAFYPSQSCLVKMLYRAGFPFVYRFQRLPLDRLYTASAWQKRQRTFLVASKSALTVDNIVLAKEPHWPVSGPSDPWATLLSRLKGQLFQLRVFLSRLAKPSRARADSASSRSGDVGVK